MVTVQICIGRSCYTGQSSKVVKVVEDMIQENHWEDQVEIKGSYCMKACEKGLGLGIKVNGKQLSGVNQENATRIIEKEVRQVLEAE